MAAVALTLEQYNDTRVRAALAEQARDETRLGRVANVAPMVHSTGSPLRPSRNRQQIAGLPGGVS